MKNEILFLCECGTPSHQFIAKWYDDEEWVALSIYLNTEHSFWERLKTGIKYIFGYKSDYGQFDEVILTKDHANDLQKVVDKLKEGQKVH